jgi:hypothetical protein
MTVQAGPVDGRAGCRRPAAPPVPEPSPVAITGLLSRSIPTAIALAARAGVFQRKHRGRWRWA